MNAIIPQNRLAHKTTWQKALGDLVTDPRELFELLDLDHGYLADAIAATKLFPLRLPRQFIDRMEPGNISDPLLQQVLPLKAEFIQKPHFTTDPLQESQHNPLPGLLHKYHGRVLLTIAGSCAINCRYCFRRTFNYDQNSPGMNGWDRIIDYIKARTEINEVIYSGGDPLIANDNYLSRLTKKLGQIPHLKRLRIHSRLPIVIPERICDDFVAWFASSRLQPILVIHCNHPNEINKSVIEKMQQLKQCGVVLLNQSVLLKGINDDAETLIALSERLFAANVMPYYLHLLDRVSGTTHFEVSEQKAKYLLLQITTKLPGYLVPKLVREEAAASAKSLIA